MWIYFDDTMTATTRVFDTPIRQGDVGDVLFVVFEDYVSFVNKFVTLQIEYPDGLLSPEVFMVPGESNTFVLPTQGDFTNGTTYVGAEYTFSDPIWFQQFGPHKITIRIYTGSGGQPTAIETSGLFTFNVEKSVFNEEASITIAQYQYLLSLINATQLDLNDVVQVVTALPNLNETGPGGFVYDGRWFILKDPAVLEFGTIYYIDGNVAVKVKMGANSLQFDASGNLPGNEIGRLEFDDAEGTAKLGLLDGSSLEVGRKSVYYGKAFVNITKGDIVQFVDTQGDHIRFKPAVVSEINANPSLIIGIAKNNITQNQFGYVVEFGEISDIDTRGLLTGNYIWFDSANVTPGQWTNTTPVAPNAKILVAVVEEQENNPSSNDGRILVRIIFNPRISDLQDVGVLSPLAGQFLVRDATNVKWENKTVGPSDVGAQPAGSYATLDGSGKVPANQLPSYVDDVLEFANFGAFPVTGETGKIYVAINNPPATPSKAYRWSGSLYVEINPQEIQTAIETPFTPFGPIAAIDVQNAVEELYNESSFISATEYSPGYVEVNFGSNVFSGYAFTVHTHDASAITSGVLDAARIPDFSETVFNNSAGTPVTVVGGSVNITITGVVDNNNVYRITWGTDVSSLLDRTTTLLTFNVGNTILDGSLFTANFDTIAPSYLLASAEVSATAGTSIITFEVMNTFDLSGPTSGQIDYAVYRIEKLLVSKI